MGRVIKTSFNNKIKKEYKSRQDFQWLGSIKEKDWKHGKIKHLTVEEYKKLQNASLSTQSA